MTNGLTVAGLFKASTVRLGCVATLALALTGCGSVSEFTDGINPFSKEKTLPGERTALFSEADPAAAITGGKASIGKASGGQSWSSAAGNPQNNPGNVAVSVSGTRVWRSSIGASGGALRASARPVSDGSRVIVYKPNGDVIALSTAGARLWSQSLRPEGEKDVAAGGGAVVSNGNVYVATGYGQVYALSGATGQTIWTHNLPTPARGVPAAGNGMIFVVTQTNEVYAIHQSDGTEAWNYTGLEETAGVMSSANPAIAGKNVIVPFSSGEIMALDTKSGEPVWVEGVTRGSRTFAVSGLSDVSASPVVSDNIVIATGVGGRTVASSLRTGERVWDQNIGAVHTPVVSGNAVFLIDLDERMVALDRKTGGILWVANLPKPEKKKQRRNWAGPVLANGALIAMSSDGLIAAVDAASGQLMASNRTNTDVFVTPIVAGGRLIVLDGDGAVAAFN